MRFTELKIPGAFLVELEPRNDERGFFSRSFCMREFEAHGLNPSVEQCNISYSIQCGTLRGMHIQRHPHEETKLVRCTRGRLYDVIVDVRNDSPTYCQWVGVELDAESRRAVYVPRGCAHGFQTLEPDTEAFYQVSAFYSKEYELGYRWNDPSFKIDWPIADAVLSDRDRMHEDFLP
ncbi:MAG: dTDP-4-dehydrorhamnose 3,5-epimerase [Chthonomonadaceae bacterium]|nr:dTDP-4-dehydrorhamnose 3,5-epimerase [Chthonomonadaceae bacterium]